MQNSPAVRLIATLEFERDGTPEENPARVLVVEDEMVVAMLVEDMLSDLGYEVAAVASRVDEALAAVDAAPIDLAILDVHLNGRAVFPVADALLAHDIPFLFATAYGEQGVPEKYRSRPILQKPYFTQELQRAIFTLCGGDEQVDRDDQ